MEQFLHSIPAAASSPYAFVAYAIAGIVALLAGAKLRATQLLMNKIEAVPEKDRRRALEIAMGTVLPEKMSPEQHLRDKRMQLTFMLLGALLIAGLAVAAIAIINPTAASLEKVQRTTEETSQQTQDVVRDGTASTAAKIDSSTQQIVSTVQDAALATLETMFPLTVRIDRDVDGTIMHLNGSPRQRLVSYDKNMQPMMLYWGDRFHYYAFRESGEPIEESTGVFLEVRNKTSNLRLPVKLNAQAEQEIRIPGRSPEPMEAYFVNEEGLSGISLKITVYSADRERGREEFRRALMNTSLNSAARRIYFEVTGDGVRLRSDPSPDAPVLRAIALGTFVKIEKRSDDGEWSLIRLPEGREGWIKSEFLSPIAS